MIIEIIKMIKYIVVKALFKTEKTFVICDKMTGLSG